MIGSGEFVWGEFKGDTLDEILIGPGQKGRVQVFAARGNDLWVGDPQLAYDVASKSIGNGFDRPAE